LCPFFFFFRKEKWLIAFLSKDKKWKNIFSKEKEMPSILFTIVFVIFVSFILTNIPNQSNFSSSYMIPLITALFTKYTLGDWDIGYRYTTLDIAYWLTVIYVSYLTVKMLNAK
jgi:hypothetical protein